MANPIELGLHRATVEALVKLDPQDPKRRRIERLAHSANLNGTGRVEAKVVLPKPEELLVSERLAWKKFLGREIEIPAPPQELFDTLLNAQEFGISTFEPHYLPKTKLENNSRAPGWKVKPVDWYFATIKEGKAAKDAAKLPGAWVLVDNTQKPEYDNGSQLYENDGFGSILASLREQGKIETPANFRHVPKTSRFAVTPQEREAHFYPALAEVLLLDPTKAKVRVTRAIEENVLGNMYHPEWGQTNTLEWFEDPFEGVNRLYGARRLSGGLANVDYYWSDNRLGNVGFRPLIEFSSK